MAIASSISLLPSVALCGGGICSKELIFVFHRFERCNEEKCLDIYNATIARR